MPIQTIIVRLATPISSGAVHAIDLGLVSLRDAAIYGRTRPLIPYAEGRLILSVRFVLGGQPQVSSFGNFYTPNTGSDNSVGSGFATFTEADNIAYDTMGLMIDGRAFDLHGAESSTAQIADCAPLILLFPSVSWDSIGTWQPNTPYCQQDTILDSNDHVQIVINTGNGVSGSSEPTFSSSGGNTTDGSVTWNDTGLVPSGTIHAIAEVMEGVSTMPPFPATLEWIDQPSTTVAGETMADITLIVKDQYGDPYHITPDIQLDILGVGTLNGDPYNLDHDLETGISTASGLSIADPGTYVIRARIIPVLSAAPIFSDPFDIT